MIILTIWNNYDIISFAGDFMNFIDKNIDNINLENKGVLINAFYEDGFIYRGKSLDTLSSSDKLIFLNIIRDNIKFSDKLLVNDTLIILEKFPNLVVGGLSIKKLQDLKNKIMNLDKNLQICNTSAFFNKENFNPYMKIDFNSYSRNMNTIRKDLEEGKSVLINWHEDEYSERIDDLKSLNSNNLYIASCDISSLKKKLY